MSFLKKIIDVETRPYKSLFHDIFVMFQDFQADTIFNFVSFGLMELREAGSEGKSKFF